jgi:23S rRNA (pseudouridine1915-N3)-methyltransferase
VRIIIAAVGRLKRGPEADLIAAYAKRLPWSLEIHEVEFRGKLDAVSRLQKETDALLDCVKNAAHVIALDERGKSFSSRKLAEHLQDRQDTGEAEIAFVIGGADGLSDGLRKRADLALSFGTATWPHMLVRVMAVEQIYRAHTILSGHPYHRE